RCGRSKPPNPRGPSRADRPPELQASTLDKSRSMPRRLANALGFVACAGLIAYALYAEHVLGLTPCPLCIFQRVAVIAVGVLFLLAALHNPGRTGARVYGVLTGLAALGGVAIAARHVWIQAQPPGTVAACGADLD